MIANKALLAQVGAMPTLKNKIINGDFQLWQRGVNVTVSTGQLVYQADRWRARCEGTGASSIYTQQPFTLGQTLVPGEPKFFAQMAVSSGGDATNGRVSLDHPIEDVRTASGKKVTVSFYARIASGSASVAVELTQAMGTGGSPSADVNTFLGKITLSTFFTRFSFTVTVPSLAGKTLGTNDNHALFLNLWMSAGTAFSARTGTLGIQVGAFQFADVQLELGDTATEFDRRPLGFEEQLCLRYCKLLGPNPAQTSSGIGFGMASSTVLCAIEIPLTVSMRAAPSISQLFGNWGVSDTLAFTAASAALSIQGLVSSPRKVTVSVTTAGSLTQYRTYRLETNSASASILYLDADF